MKSAVVFGRARVRAALAGRPPACGARAAPRCAPQSGFGRAAVGDAAALHRSDDCAATTGEKPSARQVRATRRACARCLTRARVGRTSNEGVVYTEGHGAKRERRAYLRDRPFHTADTPSAWPCPEHRSISSSHNDAEGWYAVATIEPIAALGYMPDWLSGVTRPIRNRTRDDQESDTKIQIAAS